MDSAIYLCHKVEDLNWGGGVLMAMSGGIFIITTWDQVLLAYSW